MSDGKCVPCRGTGKHLDFKCPVCSGPFFGSIGDARLDIPLKRYCSSDPHCQFQWMQYEDARYVLPTEVTCIFCSGTGNETLINFDGKE